MWPPTFERGGQARSHGGLSPPWKNLSPPLGCPPWHFIGIGVEVYSPPGILSAPPTNDTWLRRWWGGGQRYVCAPPLSDPEFRPRHRAYWYLWRHFADMLKSSEVSSDKSLVNILNSQFQWLDIENIGHLVRCFDNIYRTLWGFFVNVRSPVNFSLSALAWLASRCWARQMCPPPHILSRSYAVDMCNDLSLGYER